MEYASNYHKGSILKENIKYSETFGIHEAWEMSGKMGWTLVSFSFLKIYQNIYAVFTSVYQSRTLMANS